MNPAQKKREKFARQFHSPEFVEFTKRSACTVCFRSPCEAAHNPSRGAGGTWRDVSPLCRKHHLEQHQGVETFQRNHSIDFEQTNAQHVRAWETHNG